MKMSEQIDREFLLKVINIETYYFGFDKGGNITYSINEMTEKINFKGVPDIYFVEYYTEKELSEKLEAGGFTIYNYKNADRLDGLWFRKIYNEGTEKSTTWNFKCCAIKNKTD